MQTIQKFFLKIQDIFFVSIFIMVLLLGNRMLNLDGDLPRHLLTGKYILQTHQIPHVESFIYPYQGKPYVSHEWLANIVFYLIYIFAGLRGIVILSAILLASTFTLILNSLTKKTNLRLSIFFLVTWGTIATSLNWATRPHLISMFLLAIWLIQSDKLSNGNSANFWQFPLLMLVWSNLHGEFIAGILVSLAFAVGWTLDVIFNPSSVNLTIGKKIWGVLILSVIASMFNPGGIGPWISILGFVNNQYLMSRMLEANTPNFQSPETRVLLLLLAFSIFLLAIKKEKFPAGQSLLLAGFSAMSLIALRNIHLYGIVVPYVLAEALIDFNHVPLFNRIESNLSQIESKIKGGIWPIIISSILILFILTSQAVNNFYQFNSQSFPVQAIDWLENHPQQGRLFNDLNWGGYISLHLWPSQLTFIDSMADVTGDVTKEYETALTLASGWEQIFQKYNIEWALIPTNSPLAVSLENDLKWKILYQDKTAVILHK
ncbi:MAG: hypothetical protein U0Z26_08395 [Anaerolineales bacterium]